MTTAKTNAIEAALSSKWDKAIRFNQQIISDKPNDIEALNRLAFAYTQIGNFKEACKVYRRVLKIDRYNTIAAKNIQKYQKQPKKKKKHTKNTTSICISPTLFLEEHGKTEVIQLINVAPQSVLVTLNVGQPVILIQKKHTTEVRSRDKTYLGALSDEISFRLRKHTNKGNRYEVFIKGVSKNSITVFIRELRQKTGKTENTFADKQEKSFYPFVRKELLSFDDD